jgi:glutathione S-transferase
VLLSAAQVDHWVVLYDCKKKKQNDDGGDGDNGSWWDKSSWLNDKAWLKKQYPLINLPFLIDCAKEKVLSQTNAILTHLGHEFQMFGVGTTSSSHQSWPACQCAELLGEIMDLRDLMVNYAYDYDDESGEQVKKDKADAMQLVEDAYQHFERLEQHLKK